MKRVLIIVAILGALIAGLSGSLAWAEGGRVDLPEQAASPGGPEPHPDPGPDPREEPGIVRVYYPDLDTGNRVLLSFEAQLLETNYEEGYHVLQVTPHEIELLTRAGLRVEADPQWRPPRRPETATASGIAGYPCYRTVEETFDTALQIVADHPDLATWVDGGDSWEKTAGLGGYDMMVLRLTQSAIPGPKPALFVTAAIHAREYATAELVTRFAEYLVEHYGTDADVTWILDYHEVHLMLHANPDGRKQAESGRSWRKNTNQDYCWLVSSRRGADLNRNFDFQWACCGGSSDGECDLTYHGPYAASEPEVQAVQDYLKALFPDRRGPDPADPAPDDATGIYIDVHSYGQLVLWPWGNTDTASPNGTQFQTLGRKFAYWNGYVAQQGYGLYPTDGSSDDYAYGVLGVAAFGFELGTRFFQPCSDFEDTILPDNLPSLLYAAKVARAPYLTPLGPDSVGLSLGDDGVPVGTSVPLSGTIDDTRYDHQNGAEPGQEIAAAEVYVDTPPWVSGATGIPMSASDGSYDAEIEDVEVSLDTTGWSEGRHTLYVRGQDGDGNWGAVSALYLTLSGTLNVAPVASFTYRCAGLACDFDGSGATDPDGSIVAYDWSFGDGGAGRGVTVRHTYSTTGAYPVALTVTDDVGDTDVYTESVSAEDWPIRMVLPYVTRSSH